MPSLNQRAFRLGRRYPGIALPAFVVFWGLGTLLMAIRAADPLSPEERTAFFAYLSDTWILTSVVGLAGLVLLAIRGRLIPRDPAQMVANTIWGTRYAWSGVVIFPLVMVGGEMFNPVRMPWSGAPGMVVWGGLLGPLMLWSFIVTISLRPTDLLSSDPGVVAAAKARLATWPRPPRPLSPRESAAMDEGVEDLRMIDRAMQGTLVGEDPPEPDGSASDAGGQ